MARTGQSAMSAFPPLTGAEQTSNAQIEFFCFWTHLYHSTINFAVMHNQLFNRP
jgi:hypothetical protein